MSPVQEFPGTWAVRRRVLWESFLPFVTHSVWETENRRAYESSLQHHDCEGPVETKEKAAVYVNDLDISISVRLVETFSCTVFGITVRNKMGISYS